MGESEEQSCVKITGCFGERTRIDFSEEGLENKKSVT
jgi:hypothetical protein